MPGDCSVVQLFIPLGCRNPPSPETALVPERVGVAEGQSEHGFSEITSVWEVREGC